MQPVNSTAAALDVQLVLSGASLGPSINASTSAAILAAVSSAWMANSSAVTNVTLDSITPSPPGAGRRLSEAASQSFLADFTVTVAAGQAQAAQALIAGSSTAVDAAIAAEGAAAPLQPGPRITRAC